MADSDSLGNNLESILSKTVSFIEDSTQDIFAIAESSREELNDIRNDLLLIQQEIDEVINKLDNKEKENKEARQGLVEDGQLFDGYSKQEIKKFSGFAEDTSGEIAVLREKVEQLQQRRRKLEERYEKVEKTNRKAENLVNRMGIVKDFLNGELVDISDQFDDLRNREQLVFKIIQAQEEERKRVAREIHDGPAQSMANLVLKVELIQQFLNEEDEEVLKELDDLKDIVRLSVKDIRKIIYDLRPMSLDDLELVPTLRKYIDDFTTETGIMVELIIRGEERKMPSSYEIALFRLVQEALTNIKKHSNANSGKVYIKFINSKVKMSIIDDGSGFDQKNEIKNSYGIISMRERVKLLQGIFDISSGQDKGTRIDVVIPLNIERRG